MGKVAFVLAAGLLCSYVTVQAQFICNGQVQTFTTPVSPYPTVATYYYPIATPTGLTCTRKDQPAVVTDVAIKENQFCGGRQEFTCSLDGVTYGPVGPITHGTGGPEMGGAPEAIIPPSNPIIYSFTDAAPKAYFTYVKFTAVDVGTAGAKLGGVYGNDPTASPSVVVNHTWVANGPQGDDQVCGPCSSCVFGEGVADLTLQSAAGAGFRAIQLSASYEDTRCGNACRDFDGMYWFAREYKCIEPTCGDIDLNTPGNQAFDCAAVGLNFNASAAGSQNPSAAVCCQPGKALTCSDSNPTVPNVQYQCPPDQQFNSSAGSLPASEANCCFKPQVFTCSKSNNAGDPFACPPDYLVKPGTDDVSPPSVDNCCVKKEFNCAYSNNAGEPFTCPSGYITKPGSDNVSPPNVDNCCVKQDFTCAKSNDAGQPFTCPAGYVTKPGSENASPPSTDNCCVKQAFTCAKSNDAGQPFTCPAGYVTKPGSENASPPSTDNCCVKQAFTCAKSNDAGQPFTCPAGYVTKPGSENASPPSTENCCAKKEYTCAMSTDAGEPYQCPDGWQSRPDSGNLPATLDNCCECAPTHFGKFGKFGKFFGKGGSSCIRPPSPPPGPPDSPHPQPPAPHDEVIQIGPLRIIKKGTFQMLPFPMPFFGR